MENEVKEPAPKYNYVSPEEYLEMERISEVKHEYHNGEIFAMAGASNAHNDITYNINRLIAPFLHGKGCKLYGSDFRIHIPEHTLFIYPDFSIVCGKTETSEIYTDNLTNPTVIIEILSPSSKDYDRGTKFSFYRSIKTLKEYILIDSQSVHVEIFIKQADNSWNLKEFKQLWDSFLVSTIKFQISLRDIYEDVQFDETTTSDNALKEPAPKYNYVSPEEYLEMERISEVKHEYHNGEVFAMAGASWEHNTISFNINRILATFLHDKGCKLFGSDFRIYIPDNTLFTYPDFTIVCGEYLSSLMYSDNLTKPLVLVEILSKSTKDYDRGTKFNFYRSIKTLKEYILIDSQSVHVEIFIKQADNSWILKEFKQRSDRFTINTINFQISLHDIYDDVRFQE